MWQVLYFNSKFKSAEDLLFPTKIPDREMLSYFAALFWNVVLKNLEMSKSNYDSTCGQNFFCIRS